MTSYWCELAWLGGEHAEAGVSIEVEDGRIAAIETGVASAPEGATSLRGLTIPGLANAHSHAFQRALRGRAQRGVGTFWTWREQMYALAERLDPDNYRRLARATFAEMALAGITLVGEFHYLHHGPGGRPYADRNEIGRALIAAAGEAGVRMTLLDACYLHGGIGAELSRVQRRFSDIDAGSWAARVDELEEGAGWRVGAAIHSVRAVDPDSAEIVAQWARAGRKPLHAHVSEQPAENEECLAAYGLTPTQVIERAGGLDALFTAVHATHLTGSDIELLSTRGPSANGCVVCLCPTTERDLADGVGPARSLDQAGAILAFGTDSNAVIDMFEEARAAELDERLVTRRRGVLPAAALLHHASAGGYLALGWDQTALRRGALADFVSLDTDSVRLAGLRPEDAAASAVFAATAADVSSVIVGGRQIVRDGAHVEIDVAAELAAAIKALG
jgi:formiminoglutamate deiminase